MNIFVKEHSLLGANYSLHTGNSLAVLLLYTILKYSREFPSRILGVGPLTPVRTKAWYGE